MGKQYLIPFSAFCMLFLAVTASAQTKARISITKNFNGNKEEITREVEIKEGQDLESVLRGLDIWQEFSNVQDGETYKINIKKIKGNKELQNLDIYLGDDFQMEQKKAFLGVMLKEVKSEPETGVMISEIIEGTAADRSELKAGDIILEIDKEKVNSIDEVTRAIRNHEPGDKVKIEYSRDGKTSTTKVELGEKKVEFLSQGFHGKKFDMPTPPPPPHFETEEFEMPEMPEIHFFTPDSIEAPEFWNEKSSPFLGVTPSREKTEKGVQLGSVIQNSAAEKIGLQSGDVITQFNGQEVASFDQLADMIGKSEVEAPFKLTIERGGETMELEGTMGKRSFCEAPDFRMFRDFRGQDEDGVYRFEFQFDADSAAFHEMAEKVRKQMEEYEVQMKEYEEQIEEYEIDMELHEEKMEELESEFELREEDIEKEIRIAIEVSDITDEEVDAVNSAGNEIDLKNENSLELNSIVFFPNPNKGEIHLKFNTSEEGKLEVFVFDNNGQIVYREMTPEFSGSYENTIDISKEANGTYFLQILLNDKAYSKKLIKN